MTDASLSSRLADVGRAVDFLPILAPEPFGRSRTRVPEIEGGGLGIQLYPEDSTRTRSAPPKKP